MRWRRRLSGSSELGDDGSKPCRPEGDPWQPDDNVRGARLDRLASAAARLRSSGDSVDLSGVARRYPHWTGEFEERLRQCEAIEAARRAKDLSGAESCARPMDDIHDPTLGFLGEALTGYKPLERLDSGGQGIIYKAVQLSTDRLVAIKVLLDGPLATERQRARFAREVELVSRLNHPNIVTVYDSGIVRGRHYFAMEFVEGLPIHDYALLHSLPVRQRLELFVIVCRAVNSAHQHGIIHRDLKPTNILVDRDGQPHILDFGLAKDLASRDAHAVETSLSAPGQVVGTLPYLSPEQAAGEGSRVDVRSDVYSLGVVLYELLTECFPYPVRGSTEEVRNSIRFREPARLRDVIRKTDLGAGVSAADLDDDLQAIVFKALEKDKEQRYAFAADLAADVERYLRGEAVHAKVGRRLYVLRKTLRRYRVPVAVGAAFLVVLIGALVGTTLAWRQAARDNRMYQAGLQMGSYVKLGSVERDAGRVDQAIEMLRQAIEIGEGVPMSDSRTVQNLFDAHHGLAELLYSGGQLAEADAHCRAAVKIAEEQLQSRPDDPEWQRVVAFSYVLRGRMATSRDSWEQALSDFSHAEGLCRELLKLHPENTSLSAELIRAHGWEGQCLRKLKRYEQSLEHYTAAYELCRTLVAAEPDVDDHAIEMAYCEHQLAVWHISQRTPEHDRTASAWLQAVDDRINRLTRPHARERELVRLLESNQDNRRILARRTERLPTDDD